MSGNITLQELEFNIGTQVPPEGKMLYLARLRFKTWLQYNKLKPDPILRSKLWNAYLAGFVSQGRNPMDPEVIATGIASLEAQEAPRD